ncbi:MAG: RIP metalloprotease RseP [Spirulinaceae cyanobacterium SM2_1_0]|nr:RIP metalloprotease RseP [Spirulinaceae cyanobacterium SM2_1_0]
MAILAAIAVLAVLIIVHEFGHFAAARLQNIHVNRFAIGFGPVLLKYQGAETEYSLRALPLGGFVGFPDDDPDSEIAPDDPDLLRNRPLLDRAIVISAGVMANLIFAYFLLVGQALTLGVPELSQPGVKIPELLNQPDTPAQIAGLQAGDVIMAVGDRPLGTSLQSVSDLKQAIEQSPNQPLELLVERGDRQLDLTVTPDPDSAGRGRIGVMLVPNGEVVRRPAGGVFGALQAGAEDFQNTTTLIIQGIGQLISNFGETAGQVASPVKIVQIGADLARNDPSNFFRFGALISINLAIFNILPLPALDGGQLAFLAIEGLRGKPLPSRLQDGIMQTGIVLLFSLAIFLIARDTANLSVFQNLFQGG